LSSLFHVDGRSIDIGGAPEPTSQAIPDVAAKQTIESPATEGLTKCACCQKEAQKES